MTDAWSQGGQASPAAPRAPGHRGPKRKMIEATVPTHAALAGIAHQLTGDLGRSVTMAEALERVISYWETGVR
jgi:hypothetical protein